MVKVTHISGAEVIGKEVPTCECNGSGEPVTLGTTLLAPTR